MSSLDKNLSDFNHISVASADGFRIGVVVSQWNAKITGALLKGALDVLEKQGASEENISVVHVPGSYELIAGSDILLRDPSYDAIICLGCVIQGETRHFDFICQAVGIGLAKVGIKHGKPVIFGILTTDDLQQAKERAGGKLGNKGEEAAVTAIQMAALSQHRQA